MSFCAILNITNNGILAQGDLYIMKFDIDKININSSVKYRMMFAAGGLVHACYIGMFIWLGITPLVIVNICSVLLYCLGSILSVNKKTGLMRYGWMVAFYAEITVHTLLCMLIIGVDTNFYLYSLAIMPVAVYVLFLSCTMKVFLSSVAAFAAVDLLSLFVGFYAEMKISFLPYYPLTYNEIEMFRIFNITFAGVILLMFSFLFALEIHVLLKRLEESNRQLEYSATHDALTGLLNRRRLRPLAEKLIQSEEHFCVVLGDIDDFKKVNDTYGHDAGDLALKTVAEIIRSGVADGDIVCRWGGEEILLILCGETNECLERICGIRERIISSELEHDSRSFCLTVTFGFVDCTEARGIEKLVSIADKRLYVGKTNGKNVIITS